MHTLLQPSAVLPHKHLRFQFLYFNITAFFHNLPLQHIWTSLAICSWESQNCSITWHFRHSVKCLHTLSHFGIDGHECGQFCHITWEVCFCVWDRTPLQPCRVFLWELCTLKMYAPSCSAHPYDNRAFYLLDVYTIKLEGSCLWVVDVASLRKQSCHIKEARFRTRREKT